MGLIINKRIRMFKVGYPTVSDKYNVTGGILDGATPAKFGDLVKITTVSGNVTQNGCYYEPAAGATNVNQIAGFILATNVKLAEDWPGTTVQVNPGEAFNLCVGNSFLAVELDAAATPAQITPNAQVCVILATGKVTTADKYNATTAPYLPNCVFTGLYENHGTTAAPKYVAEVFVK